MVILDITHSLTLIFGTNASKDLNEYLLSRVAMKTLCYEKPRAPVGIRTR